MTFQPIFRRGSTVDACAEALRRAILSGALEPGERLPPERKLAEQLGVNRVTVRSALAQLAQSSLVSVRQGSGYVVQDYRTAGGPDLLPGLLSLGVEHGDLAAIAKDLLLVRRHLARAVLERLATSADEDGVAAISLAVDRFAEGITDGPDVVARADLAVLAAILDATKSPVLRLCLNPVLTVVTSMPDLRAAIYAEPEGSLLGWRALVLWLASARDPERIEDIVAELAQRDLVTLSRLRSTHA